jgi:hypothetical protein
MSDLYKEALADAAKIREIAEQDARSAILERINPYIKQMIAKEASNSFLLEQEDMTPEAPAPDAAMAMPDAMAPSEMPITPAGGSDVVNVPMPSGTDGKITLSFDDLFASEGVADIVNPADISQASSMEVATSTPAIEAAPEMPAPSAPVEAPTAEVPTAEAVPATPPAAGPTPAPETAGAAAEEEVAPAAPIAEAKTIKQFERQLAEMAVKIDRMYTTKVTALTEDAYKTKLFSLLEQLDSLAANKVISPKQAQLNENRLEFLFLHLKEANLNNSYNKQKDKDTTMTTLKEFAAKLFEGADNERLAQDSKSSGETGVAVHKAATAHAMKASGVHADLFGGGSKTTEKLAAAGSVDADELEGLDGEEGPWEQALLEEVEQALRDELDAHEKPEAGEVPAAVSDSGYFEISEAALKEAVAKIRKEAAAKKTTSKSAIKEAARKKLLEMMGAAAPDGMDEDLVLSVELPDEVEEQLADEDLDVDLMFSGEEEEEEGGEEEVVDLDMSAAGDEGMGSEEEEMLLTDEEGGEEEMDKMAKPMMESRRVRKALLESRTREVKSRRLAEAKRAETATLKKEMAETNLFLSKLVYLNKFLVREDLSRKVKQQIVEHLDRASTIAEAKDIYGKIVRKLDEAAAAHTAPVVGSASKPTTAGSARLNEGVTRAASSNGSEPVIGTFEKWQILANIKRNND